MRLTALLDALSAVRDVLYSCDIRKGTSFLRLAAEQIGMGEKRNPYLSQGDARV